MLKTRETSVLTGHKEREVSGLSPAEREVHRLRDDLVRWLREYDRTRRVSQEEIARKAGVSQFTVSAVFRGGGSLDALLAVFFAVGGERSDLNRTKSESLQNV